MSKFKIYRINKGDPKVVGKQNKRLIAGYSILFLLTYFTIIYSGKIKSKYEAGDEIYYLILAVLALATLYLAFRIWRQVKQLNRIGTLEFTQTTIRKEIGDLRFEYKLDNILRIEVERHIRALTVFQSISGSVTYIIRIVQKNLQEDQFVVSDKSVDFGEKISIINTLNTIKKIAGIEVIINKPNNI